MHETLHNNYDTAALHQVSSDMDGSDDTEMVIHQEVAPLLLPLACEAPPLLPPPSSPASNGQEAHQPTISVTQLLCMDGQQSADRAPTSNASVRTAPPPLPDPRLPPPTSAQGGSWSHFESAGAFPRVAHRHLYLWLDQKISELPENEAKRVKAVGRLDSFYEEVNRANAANTLYDAAKLKEFVAKPSPYSLLLFQEEKNGRQGATGGASVAKDAIGDGEKEREEGLIATGLGDQLPRKRRRQGPSGLSSTSSSGRNKGTLNLSTNVLKRWNRSNGMINWFLWRLGRAPPAMEEVLQLARMHAARALLKIRQGPRSTLAKGEGEGKGEREARAWRRKGEPGREGGVGMEGKEGAAEREMSGAEQKLEGEGGAGEGQRPGKGSAGWEREEGDQEGWAGGREGGSLPRRKARQEEKGENGGERKKAAALDVAPTLDGEGVKRKGGRREGWRKGGRKGAGRGGEEDEERQAGDQGIEGTVEEDEERMGGCREEGGRTGEREGAQGPPEGQAAGGRREEATVGGVEGGWRGARPEAWGHIGQRGNEAAPPLDLDSISSPSPPAPSPPPSLSLPPVPAGDTAALYSTLKARHAQMGGSEGLSLEAVEIAVREGFWKRVEGAGEGGSVGEGGGREGEGGGGGYVPVVERMEEWSMENGLWQHFACFCRERGSKMDAVVFDFKHEVVHKARKCPRAPVARPAGRGRGSKGGGSGKGDGRGEATRQNREQDVSEEEKEGADKNVAGRGAEAREGGSGEADGSVLGTKVVELVHGRDGEEGEDQEGREQGENNNDEFAKQASDTLIVEEI